MQFSEDQAAEVKTWVVKKLEDISDADSDVLADYVLALIRTDAPDDDIKKASVENLEDFLREHTVQFVDDLFSTFAPQKEAPPSAPQSQFTHHVPAPVSAPQQPNAFNPMAGSSNNFYGSPMGGAPQQQGGQDTMNASRKRSFHEGFQADQELPDAPHNRNLKTPRRGRGGGRGDWMGRDSRAPAAVGQYPAQPSGGFPVMPPGFPSFDQNDPMAAMMALQSMGFPQMPGMPGMPPMPMPPGAPGQQPDQMAAKSNERCPFYETQGICYLGNTCPYQHDLPGASKDDEYDPKSANIMMDNHGRDGGGRMRGGDRGRGRGRGRGDRGGFGPRGRRSEFSAAGPNEDTSIATIVVEQIPDDKLDEQSVREFFSQYGEIVDLSLQPAKKLALVTYDSHATAKQAWSSPKVIFDNRFVKVYWHKPNDRNGEQRQDEGPAFNQEEFEKQQEEAQKAYEEKLQKRRETEEAKQALERQRDELLKKQQEEKERLLQRLGGQGAGNGAEPMGDEAPVDENVSDQTKQLRAQLAALEAEAKTLGIDPNAEPGSPFAPRGRGRGYLGSRGRGGFPPRGRGYDPSFRGGYRGRGGMARGRGGVLRLDNRPRRVAVSGVEFNSDKDEALRQFLIGIGEYESIEPNTEQPNSVIVVFKERYQAERFMFGSWSIPSVGDVQLTWIANPPITAPTTPGAGSDTKTGSDEDAMDTTTGSHPDQLGARKDNADVDYDVAEMDDSWGVE